MASLVLLAAVAGLVSAAGTTGVVLTPEEQVVESGSSTAYSLNVTDADGGVGAYNITISLEKPEAGRITRVSLPSEPLIREVTYADDNSSVQIEVVGLDTSDNGSVTVATVSVQTAGEEGLSSGLTVHVEALGDEDGNSYTVSYTEPATLHVGQDPTETQSGRSSNSSSGSVEGTATSLQTRTTTSFETTENNRSSIDTSTVETASAASERTADTTGGDAPSTPSDSTGSDSTSTSIPGFSAAVSVVGALVAAILLGRN